MKLTDILARLCVGVPLEATDTTGVIEELVDLLVAAGKVQDREAVLKAVLERERTRSTGIGYGLAVPHGKSAGCPTLAMAIGRPIKPIDFGGSDGRPANIICLLASPPDRTGPHIQALARISRFMLVEEFRTSLAEATDADAFYNVIREHDGAPPASPRYRPRGRRPSRGAGRPQLPRGRSPRCRLRRRYASFRRG